MAGMGAVGCFALSAASYLPLICVAMWILPRGAALAHNEEKLDRRDLFAEIRHVAGQPDIRGALLTVLATSTLCGPLIIFGPVLVRDIMHGDAGEFSIAMGSFGIGGLLGAIGLLGVDVAHDRRRMSSWSAASYGLLTAVAGLSPWFWALPVLLVLAGLSMSVSNTSANSLLQTTVSPALRGRAVSLYILALQGGISIGSLVTGMSVSFLGVRDALLINGILAVTVHLAVVRQWMRSTVPT